MKGDVWKGSSLSRHSVPRRSPWCPSAEDGAFLLEATATALNADSATVLALGITAEILALAWPEQVRLITVDSSAGMIASSWHPSPGIASEVTCAWWQEMPLDDQSVDAAVGDGSLNALPAFDQYPTVLGQIARVLKPGGVLGVRCFLRPEPRETPEQVMALAMAGAFPIMSGFRLRLAMALTESGGSMTLGEVPAALARLAPDRDALAAATGWSRAEIDLTDTGAGSPIRITFPSEAELRGMVAPHFEPIGLRRGGYTQAEHCPTLILRLRQA